MALLCGDIFAIITSFYLTSLILLGDFISAFF